MRTVTLQRADASDAEQILLMQKASFAPLLERYQDYDDNDFLELDNKLDLEYATPRENLLFNLEKLPYITKTYAALFITTLDRGYTETCESESIHDLLDSITLLNHDYTVIYTGELNNNPIALEIESN